MKYSDSWPMPVISLSVMKSNPIQRRSRRHFLGERCTSDIRNTSNRTQPIIFTDEMFYISITNNIMDVDNSHTDDVVVRILLFCWKIIIIRRYIPKYNVYSRRFIRFAAQNRVHAADTERARIYLICYIIYNNWSDFVLLVVLHKSRGNVNNVYMNLLVINLTDVSYWNIRSSMKYDANVVCTVYYYYYVYARIYILCTYPTIYYITSFE